MALDTTRLLASLFECDEQLVALDVLCAHEENSIEAEELADPDGLDWDEDDGNENE